MGSIHKLKKFIPNLASLVDRIRPLLKNDNKLNNNLEWIEKHSNSLEAIIHQISKITEKMRFDKLKNTGLKFKPAKKA